MRISAPSVLSICFVILVACSHSTRLQAGPDGLTVVAPSGLKMRVAEEDSDPTLWLSVPDGASGQDAVLVLLPEHVTVRRRGTSEAQHLYLWQALIILDALIFWLIWLRWLPHDAPAELAATA